MKPLYSIALQIKRCFRVNDSTVVDGETGEVFDAAYLDQLKMDKTKKVDNIACWIKDLQAEADACKAQEEAFRARRKSVESRINHLMEYLTTWIPGENMDTKRARIRWRKSTSVAITDAKAVPSNYKHEEVVEKIDKTEVKKALKAGIKVFGAQLVEKQNIQIK